MGSLKRSIFFCLLSMLGVCAYAQEFDEHPNGLIYDDVAIGKLQYIVDSLNVKFKQCDASKIYYSLYQAKGHFVRFGGKTKQLRGIVQDMDNAIPWDSLISKHKKRIDKQEKKILIIKHRYRNAESPDVIRFSSFGKLHEIANELDFANSPELYHKNKVEFQWIYKWQEKERILQAYYFLTDLIRSEIPRAYAEMIQYAECVIDTNSQVLLLKDDATFAPFPEITPKVKAFMELIQYPGQPEIDIKKIDETSIHAFARRYEEWNAKKLAYIDSALSRETFFKIALVDAVHEATSLASGNDELEMFAEKYLSKATALELKRRRHVIGDCSMDFSPRMHAQQIARLAAETTNWEVFLKAHLDIMNDNFERVSDGSWAWAGRETYIKELEVLNFDVLRLLLGVSLSIENPARNFYHGDITRLGRALTESREAGAFEALAGKMIRDQHLDDFNRIKILFLYLSYISSLDDVDKKNRIIHELQDAATEWPEYLVEFKFENSE